MVLFIMEYKVVLTFESVDVILKVSVTIQMKATEQNCLVVLFTLQSNHVLTFSSVKGILQL